MSNRLPTVTSKIPPDLRRFLDRVRESLGGGGLDRAVTLRELRAAGLLNADGTGAGSAILSGGESLCATPPALTDVEASGAMTSILVTWSGIAYTCHAYTEVWRAAIDNLGDAVLIGISPGTMYSDAVGSNASHYYWVRAVNTEGEVGAYNAVTGTPGETAPDVEYLLEQLTGSITESQLYADLTSRIDLIDGPDTLAGSVAQRLADEAQARAEALTLEAALREIEDAALSGKVDYEVSELTAELATTDSYARGSVQSLEAAIATEASARALTLDILTAEVQTDRGANTAELKELRETLADETSAQATALDSLTAEVEAETGTRAAELTRVDTTIADETLARTISTYGNRALITSEKVRSLASVTEYRESFANEQQARATAIDMLEAEIEDERLLRTASVTETREALVDEFGQSIALSASELSAQVATDRGVVQGQIQEIASVQSSAEQVATVLTTTLQAQFEDQTAAIQENLEAMASADGTLGAKYTLKVDVAGHVAGYGLAAESNTAGATSSQFLVTANQFAIMPPAVVQGTAPHEDNRYPGMVWVNDTVDPAVTQYWDADANSGAGGWVTESPLAPFIVQTTETTLDNGDKVPAGVYMNAAYIQNGAITTAQIGNATIDTAQITGKLTATSISAGSISSDTYIRSSNYVAGSQGWQIDGSGVAEFSSGTFRGTLSAGGATSYNNGTGFWAGTDGTDYKTRIGTTDGARLEWDGSKLAIYNDQGTAVLQAGSNVATVGVINYIGEFSSAPTAESYGSEIPINSVYKNTTDGNSYIYTASGWETYLEKGEKGADSTVPGPDGRRGSERHVVPRSVALWDDDDADAAVSDGNPVPGDQVTQVCATCTPVWVETRAYTGSSWDEIDVYIDGNLLVDGSITADKIGAGEITAEKINTTNLSSIEADLGTVTAGRMESLDGDFIVDLTNKYIKIEL